MFFSSKEVLSHRWKALFATQASEVSRQRMMAKSPLRPHRFWHTASSCPHTCSKREKRAKMCATRARLCVGSSRR